MADIEMQNIGQTEEAEQKSKTHHHHRHRSPEEKKRDLKIEIIAKTLAGIAALMFIPYMVIEYVPFIRSIIEYKKINMSTMSYSALRIMLAFVPVLLVLPEKLYHNYTGMRKINLIAKWFAVISFLFFTTMVVDIMSYNIFAENYIDTGENPIVLKMLWGNIGLNGLLFSLLQCVGYLFLWKRIEGHRKEVIIFFSMIYGFYMIFPFATGIIMGADFSLSPWSTWLEKNIWFFLSDMFLLSGIIVSANSRRVWSRLIWQ